METIITENLVKRMGRFTLGPVDLRVRPAEILGIMGPNGAGKTTLLRLLWGFGRPDSGKATVFGLVPHLEQLKLRLRAGFLAENPQFYDTMTAASFLRFVGNFYENWDARRSASLLEEFRIPPDTRLRNLSRGNRMKLALVSATGHSPSLLILDEPTSGLDPVVRLDMLRFLQKLSRQDGTTILLSSHISDDLDQIADTVLMLDNGRPIEYASAAKLQQKHKLDRLEAIFLNALGTEHHS